LEKTLEAHGTLAGTVWPKAPRGGSPLPRKSSLPRIV
jgi:hypothetical protein